MTPHGKSLPRRLWPGAVAHGLVLTLAALQGTAEASGFRITNQSLGAVGLSGAHIAHTPGPDSSYYNPANMAWLADQ